MNEGQFTDQAAIFWSSIPQEARAKILANVFCINCRDIVTMTDIKGKEQRGDIYLEGVCERCGQPVVRLIEISEQDNSTN